MFFNPFSHLVINENYPLAKVRRSSLIERFSDTFEVFNGKLAKTEISVESDGLLLQKQNSHVGITDYIVPLFLPLTLLAKAYPESVGTKILQSVKGIFSGLFTAVASPFIVVGHVISLVVNAVKDREIEDLQVNMKEDQYKQVQSGQGWATPCLSNSQIQDSKLRTIPHNLREEATFSAKENQVDIDNIKPYVRSNIGETDINYSNVNAKPNEQNNPAIRWILASNYGHVLEQSAPKDIAELSKILDKDTKKPKV